MGAFSSFSAFFASTWGKLAVTAGLDLAAGLIGGGGKGSSPQGRLADRNVTSQNYGTVWPRCRGVVRLPGKVIQSTIKQEVLHKRVGGGILGIGQQSEYFYTYSVNCAVAFAKKLGGGQAAALLKLWGNGKLIYSAEVTNATLAGSVTVIAGNGTDPVALAGATNVQIVTGSDGSVNMPAGTDFTFAAEPNVTYESQVDLVMGPNETKTLSFWPPLDIDLFGSGQLSIPGLNGAFYNQEAFLPQADVEKMQGVSPQSHVDSDPEPDRAGGVHIYTGALDQLPDEFTIKQFGAKSPGYRGMPYVMIFRLKLSAAFGNEIPSFSAKWAFESADANNFVVGPIAGVTISSAHNRNSIVLPSEFGELGSLQTIPYAVVTVWTSGETGTAFVINSNTNQLVGSFTLDMTTAGPGIMMLDNDGFLYSQENATSPPNLEKYDILSGTLKGQLPAVFGSPLMSGGLETGFLYDSPSALDPYANFNKPMRMILLGSKDDGTVQLIDRGNMQIVGGPGGSTMMTGLSGVGAAPIHFAVDRHGDIWVAQSNKLFKCDGQFGTPIPNPLAGSIPVDPIGIIIDGLMGAWIIVYPTMEILETVDLPSDADNIIYDPSDDTIVVLMADSTAVKVNYSTALMSSVSTIDYPSGVTADGVASASDIQGTIIVGGGGSVFVRIPLAQIGVATTITPTAYHVDDFIDSSTGVTKKYDPLTNSVWVGNASVDQMVYRIFLDRISGVGLSLDVLVASILTEAGYQSSEYDVSELSDITVGGWEVGEESYQQTLQKLAQLYKFDVRERDGKLECILRGGNPIDTIVEDDLGALSDPYSSEPRVIQTIVDEKDLPREVHINYYDHLKEDQQAEQYSSRTQRPYAASLSSALNQMNSQEILNLGFPLFDNATPVKKLADMQLDDLWASRKKVDFKTSIKHIRKDPADVINLSYKGIIFPCRLMEQDAGAGFAQQFKGESSFAFAYQPADVIGDPGIGSGGEPGQGPGGGGTNPPPTDTPPPPPVTVITTLLGSASDATVEIDAPTDGAFELEHFQTFTPAFAIIEMFGEGGNVWLDGAHGTLIDSTKLYLAASAVGVKAKAFLFKTAPASLTTLAPANGPSEFNVANPLHSAPGLCLPIMTSGGNIWNQTQIADADFLYFTKSGDGVTGIAALWAALTGSATPSITCKRIPIAAQAAGGPFIMRHGVGSPIKNVFIHMNAPGFPKFWFQDGVSGAPDGYDDLNLYLVAPDSGVSGFAEVLY